MTDEQDGGIVRRPSIRKGGLKMKISALDRPGTFSQRSKKRQEQTRRASRPLYVSAAYPAQSFADVLKVYLQGGESINDQHDGGGYFKKPVATASSMAQPVCAWRANFTMKGGGSMATAIKETAHIAWETPPHNGELLLSYWKRIGGTFYGGFLADARRAAENHGFYYERAHLYKAQQ